jgi:hypothetical protein
LSCKPNRVAEILLFDYHRPDRTDVWQDRIALTAATRREGSKSDKHPAKSKSRREPWACAQPGFTSPNKGMLNSFV